MLALVATLALQGCFSMAGLTSARTLEQGKLQHVLAVTVLPAGVGQSTLGAPTVDGQLRYGLTDRVEAGGKLGLTGVAGDVKVALIRPDSGFEGFNLSVDPGVVLPIHRLHPSLERNTLYVHLPVLLGYRFNGHEVTLGARLVPAFNDILLAAPSGWRFNAVANLGVTLRVADGVRLMPEVSVLTPLRAWSASTSLGERLLPQFTLGVALGGDD